MLELAENRIQKSVSDAMRERPSIYRMNVTPGFHVVDVGGKAPQARLEMAGAGGEHRAKPSSKAMRAVS